MSSEAVVAAGVPTEAGLSQIERVVDTFVAPSKTFKDILRSGSCWVPIVLLILSSFVSGYVVDKQVGFDRVFDNSVHQSSFLEKQMESATPEQKAAIEKRGVAQSKYGAYGSFVFILIFFAIYSLILWASFNFGLGAKTTFSQVFAVTVYAALPYLVMTVLLIFTLYFGGNAEAYDYRNPVGTNLAYYMPDVTGPLKGILDSLDIVKIWSDVLQVIGMAIIAKKSIAQAAVIVGIFWLVGVGFSVVGAMF
jgi:hypothetical protein